MTPVTDEELVRAVLADRAATPREKEMARRILRLLYTLDGLEEILFGQDNDKLGCPEFGRMH